MVVSKKRIFSISIRYTAIILLFIGNFKLLYNTLTPVTIKVLTVALRLFYDIVSIGNIIYVRGATIEVASSCIAAAAFFLMFFLVFSTPDIKPKKRVLALIISFAILFVLNIARMVFLVSIIHSPYFDAFHWMFQNLLSVVVVAATWIWLVSLLKIKTIPVFSDAKYIYGLIKKPKR